MGEKTGISWTDHTFNPWWGCIRVSPGCEHCYAETFSKRMGLNIWGPTGRRFFGEKHWAEPLKWNLEAARDGKRYKVFCASMADVFEDFPGLDVQREKLWNLIEATPWLDWQICTKRIENVDKMLPQRWLPFDDGFPKNIWLGITTENETYFQKRWPVLEWLGRMWFIPKLWISAEPLLGPINMRHDLEEEIHHEDDEVYTIRGIDWVICGGESGASCRPMDVEWARDLRNQCQQAEVPFFMKQLGGFPDKRHDMNSWPDDLRIQEFPKG